ncbi:MAG: hypothetical protein CVT69_01455 [Actinobacteria bacterium HGW-Actinobacteria-9]|nr:MAG: hypothetical protein CVU37_07245 [candidate division BRC1 bacterium HGW-BRC1-1]PKQ10105.1 MAG: hypothetical protein CVT69_01455 [Actinobacteria bacterium HGW-Actinobacteria-9]
MVYYSGQPVMDLGRFNTWGLDHYNLQLDEEEFGWNSCEPELQDYDFDLAPWIARGSLLWIAPGDETLELREGTDGCPYLDITDRHLPQCIEDGEVWTASLWDGTVPDDEPADAGPADVADGPSPVATENPAPEAAGPKFCSHCGAGLREGAKFCTGCGAKIGV